MHNLPLIKDDKKWPEYKCPICGYHTFRNKNIQPGEKRANVINFGDINVGHIINGEGMFFNLDTTGENLEYGWIQ